jgi:hypothetical protein
MNCNREMNEQKNNCKENSQCSYNNQTHHFWQTPTMVRKSFFFKKNLTISFSLGLVLFCHL